MKTTKILCLGLLGASLIAGCGGGTQAGAPDARVTPDSGNKPDVTPDTGNKPDVTPDTGGKPDSTDGSADSAGDGRQDSADGGPSDASSPDGGNDGGLDGGNDNRPIAARPSRGAYVCRLERPRTDHSPRFWRSSALVATGATAQLVRHEAMTANPIIPPMRTLVLGSMTAEGTFGPTTPVAGITGDVESIAAVPRGDGLAVVFIEGTKLRFAAFDATNKVVVAPKDIAPVVDVSSPPRLVAGPDGNLGLLYGTATGNTSRTVEFVVLDRDGVAKGPVRRIDQATNNTFVPAAATRLVAGPTGYSMIWRSLAEARGGIDFAKAGLDGAEAIARRRISVTNDSSTMVGGGAGFETPTTALLETSSGYLAAWPEVRQVASPQGGASSVVNLVRLDSMGNRLGMPVPMRAPVDSIDEVEPTLVPFGDAVGVLWGRGSHIYICGGCMPDNRIDLLLVDPTDLTPVSNLVTIANPEAPARGGLLRRQVAVVGKSLLTTYDLNFHVHYTSGSASIACER